MWLMQHVVCVFMFKLGQYQAILLADRHMGVNDMPKVVTQQCSAGAQTRDPSHSTML